MQYDLTFIVCDVIIDIVNTVETIVFALSPCSSVDRAGNF